MAYNSRRPSSIVLWWRLWTEIREGEEGGTASSQEKKKVIYYILEYYFAIELCLCGLMPPAVDDNRVGRLF